MQLPVREKRQAGAKRREKSNPGRMKSRRCAITYMCIKQELDQTFNPGFNLLLKVSCLENNDWEVKWRSQADKQAGESDSALRQNEGTPKRTWMRTRAKRFLDAFSFHRTVIRIRFNPSKGRLVFKRVYSIRSVPQAKTPRWRTKTSL